MASSNSKVDQHEPAKATLSLDIPAAKDIIESVKDSMRVLFGPASNELGQLIADRVRFWRWRSAINILDSAAEIRKLEAIKGEISLKLLLPFVEEASKEQSEDLSQMWARLLASSSEKSTGFDLFCVEILKSIGSSEAKILFKMWGGGENDASSLHDSEEREICLVSTIVNIKKGSVGIEALVDVVEQKYQCISKELNFAPMLLDFTVTSTRGVERELNEYFPDKFTTSVNEGFFRENLQNILTLVRLGLIHRDHLLTIRIDVQKFLGYLIRLGLIQQQREQQRFYTGATSPEISARGITFSDIGREFMTRCTNPKRVT